MNGTGYTCMIHDDSICGDFGSLMDDIVHKERSMAHYFLIWLRSLGLELRTIPRLQRNLSLPLGRPGGQDRG